MSTETKKENIRLRAEVYDKMFNKFTNSINEILEMTRLDANASLTQVKMDLNGYEIKFTKSDNGSMSRKKMRRRYTHDENPIVKTLLKPKPKPKAKAKTKTSIRPKAGPRRIRKS